MDIGKNMKRLLKRTLFLTTALLVLSSCAKEEFSTNKGKQSASTSEAITTSAKLCSQSTLISPQVDILMLWDNTSSFNFVNSSTKSSMSNLISSVSENFDYHVLSAPLVPANGGASSGGLYEAQLIAKNSTGLTLTATSILRTKENAIASLGFTQGVGSSEAGIDRAYNIISQNRSNGIFRTGAYTIVVVISNEDDKGCSMISATNPNGVICSSPTDYNKYLAPRIQNFLTLRGNSVYAGAANLNSSMMRFINISPLTSCSSGNYKTNYMYRAMAKTIYETPYTNDWPTSNDHLSPDLVGYPDSYNLCSMDFSHIFDGVNTAIKQTLLKHKYDYWPLASTAASVDPETVRIVRSDGVELVNRKVDNSTNKGFEVILDNDGAAANLVGQNTRYEPTIGEPFTGKLIKLFNEDRVVYPDCLTVKYTEVKSTYGYIYLQYGEPSVSTIEVRINNVVVPQSSENGWDYMGLQFTDSSSINSSYKIANMPAGTSSGYFLRLNGTAKKSNSASNTFTIYYLSK
jgi:hypothetical protein